MASEAGKINIESLREEFPALSQKVYDAPLVYLDSAATTLKPKSVIKDLSDFYLYGSANVHRGAHFLSDQATEKFEGTRSKVQKFLNAKSANEIIFTKGTTDSINLVAHAFGERFLREGDEILLSQMEHHSNIVPWQILAEKKGLTLKFISVTDIGELDMDDFHNKLTGKTKIISIVHASNTLGTVNDIKKITQIAKSLGARVMVDAAQSVSFENIDVQDIGCDFLCFSAHKLFGPNGVGVLYGKEEVLSELPPYQGGGAMIERVTEKGVSFLKAPQRFEAGTPHIAGVIALGSAIDFVGSLGLEEIKNHERSLCQRLARNVREIKGVKLMGESKTKVNIVSFNVEGVHPSDVGPLLDRQGIAVRTGHHCTQPLMDRFQVPGTIRASLSVYNNEEDVDNFVKALAKAKGFF